MFNHPNNPTEFLVKNLNLGYWNALVLYYTTVLIIAVFLTIIFVKKKKISLKIISLTFPILLVSIAFGLNPIYDNDTIIGGKITQEETYQELFNKNSETIILFADPNCSHCEDLIRRLNIMESKIKNNNILLILNDLDSDELIKFSSTISKKIKVKTISNEAFLNYTKGRFPMVLLKKNEKKIQQWYNSNIGIKTMDYFVNQ